MANEFLLYRLLFCEKNSWRRVAWGSFPIQTMRRIFEAKSFKNKIILFELLNMNVKGHESSLLF